MNNDIIKIVFIAENGIVNVFNLSSKLREQTCCNLQITKFFAEGINQILTNGCDVLISGITFSKSSFNGIWNQEKFDSISSGVDYLCQASDEIKKIPLIVYTAKLYDESHLKLKDAGVNFKKILYWKFSYNCDEETKKLIDTLKLIIS